MKRIFLVLGLIISISQLKAQQLVQERVFNIHNTRTAVNTSCLTKQGSVLFSGNYTVNSGGYRHEFMLVKPNLDTLWTKRGVLFCSGSHEIKEKPSGGFALFGALPNNPLQPGNQCDILVQGITSIGLPQWQKIYNFNTYEFGNLLQNSPDGGYFLGGQGGVPNKQSPFSLLKADSIGNIKWQKDLSWSAAEAFVDMKYTSSGDLITAGFTYDANLVRHIKLMLVNQNGDSILGRVIPTVNSIQNEIMQYTYGSVTPLTNGGFLVTSQVDTIVNGLNKYRGMVVKTDANLNPVWRYIKYPYQQNVTFTKARELTDGSLLVMGFSYPTATNTFYFYHFSTTGTLLNVYPFTSTISNEVRAVTLEVLADSSLMIGGEATVTSLPNFTGGMYVAKVKFPTLAPVVPPITITGIKSDLAYSTKSLGQSYPNPTATEAIIPYSLPKNYRKSNIIIRELATGRGIRKYELKRNENNLKVDLSNFNNGLYLYSLEVDDKPIATKKLAVMK